MSSKQSRAGVERRYLTAETIELRAKRDTTGALATLEGYAAVFTRWSEPLGLWFRFREQIAPGAFSKTIGEADIRALWNHDPRVVLGRNKPGTLRLSEDDHGLRSEIDLPDNEWGRPVLDAVERGDVTGMSFAFEVIKESWRWAKEPGELDERTLHEVRLHEVSPVTFPAYTDTEIGARSLLDATGLDLAVIGQILARQQRGLPVAPADGAALQRVIDLLTTCLPAEPGARNAHHSAAPAREPALVHSRDWYRRRLTLLTHDTH